MMDDLTPVLSRLPEPMPSSTLTATVMARIEREAEQKAADKVAVPVSRGQEFGTWLWTFAGVALVLMGFINGWVWSGVLPNVIDARIGLNHAPVMPVGPDVTVFLGLGLIAFVAGLFAPLRSSGRDST